MQSSLSHHVSSMSKSVPGRINGFCISYHCKIDLGVRLSIDRYGTFMELSRWRAFLDLILWKNLPREIYMVTAFGDRLAACVNSNRSSGWSRRSKAILKMCFPARFYVKITGASGCLPLYTGEMLTQATAEIFIYKILRYYDWGGEGDQLRNRSRCQKLLYNRKIGGGLWVKRCCCCRKTHLPQVQE